MLFQSTPRVRGESSDSASFVRYRGVSIHAPRAGRKQLALSWDEFQGVSIHAPRAGRKPRNVITNPGRRSFNPRPACGAKAQPDNLPDSTTTVSIHAPRAGRKAELEDIDNNARRFNPRPACGAKDGKNFHGPRPGWFQSTPRVRGESRFPANSMMILTWFQSTPRVRGERTSVRSLFYRSGCFNPRPACGAKAPATIFPSMPSSFNPRPACGAKDMNLLTPGSFQTFQSTPRVRGERST